MHPGPETRPSSARSLGIGGNGGTAKLTIDQVPVGTTVNGKAERHQTPWFGCHVISADRKTAAITIVASSSRCDVEQIHSGQCIAHRPSTSAETCAGGDLWRGTPSEIAFTFE